MATSPGGPLRSTRISGFEGNTFPTERTKRSNPARKSLGELFESAVVSLKTHPKAKTLSDWSISSTLTSAGEAVGKAFAHIKDAVSTAFSAIKRYFGYGDPLFENERRYSISESDDDAESEASADDTDDDISNEPATLAESSEPSQSMVDISRRAAMSELINLNKLLSPHMTDKTSKKLLAQVNVHIKHYFPPSTTAHIASTDAGRMLEEALFAIEREVEGNNGYLLVSSVEEQARVGQIIDALNDAVADSQLDNSAAYVERLAALADKVSSSSQDRMNAFHHKNMLNAMADAEYAALELEEFCLSQDPAYQAEQFQKRIQPYLIDMTIFDRVDDSTELAEAVVDNDIGEAAGEMHARVMRSLTTTTTESSEAIPDEVSFQNVANVWKTLAQDPTQKAKVRDGVLRAGRRRKWSDVSQRNVGRSERSRELMNKAIEAAAMEVQKLHTEIAGIGRLPVQEREVAYLAFQALAEHLVPLQEFVENLQASEWSAQLIANNPGLGAKLDDVKLHLTEMKGALTQVMTDGILKKILADFVEYGRNPDKAPPLEANKTLYGIAAILQMRIESPAHIDIELEDLMLDAVTILRNGNPAKNLVRPQWMAAPVRADRQAFHDGLNSVPAGLNIPASVEKLHAAIDGAELIDGMLKELTGFVAADFDARTGAHKDASKNTSGLQAIFGADSGGHTLADNIHRKARYERALAKVPGSREGADFDEINQLIIEIGKEIAGTEDFVGTVKAFFGVIRDALQEAGVSDQYLETVYDETRRHFTDHLAPAQFNHRNAAERKAVRDEAAKQMRAILKKHSKVIERFIKG